VSDQLLNGTSAQYRPFSAINGWDGRMDVTAIYIALCKSYRRRVVKKL